MHDRIFRQLEGILPGHLDQSRLKRWLNELLAFAAKNALSCLFPVAIFSFLVFTRYVTSFGLPRYDAMLVLCLLMQAFMYYSRLETWDEVKVICLFHVLGLGMEIYKVHHGSWSYPLPAFAKVFGVPLYSGFMYASVASYITQSWRYFRTAVDRWPSHWLVRLLGAAIYLNFFTDIYFYDLRWILIVAMFVLFARSTVSFTSSSERRWMPVSLSFLLIGLFIWIAENVATFLGAWQYAYQKDHWTLVHPGTISSWFLLVIVSFILVAELKMRKAKCEVVDVETMKS